MMILDATDQGYWVAVMGMKRDARNKISVLLLNEGDYCGKVGALRCVAKQLPNIRNDR
jgi:hypothetical protein